MKKILLNHVFNNNALLHGSPKNINEIHPLLTDGELAICATQYPEIAIFMTVVGACKKGKHTFSIHRKDGQLRIKFIVCEEKLQELLSSHNAGFVYTIDADHFRKVSPVEHRTYDPVYIQQKFEVKKEHLPFIPLKGHHEYMVFISQSFSPLLN